MTKELLNIGIGDREDCDAGFTTWAATRNEDGKKGLRDTMRYLFEYCLGMGHEKVCVFEDDCKFLPADPDDLLLESIRQLPYDYDLLYMGGNLAKTPKRYSANLFQCEGIYSSHAIVYSKAAIELILTALGTQDKAYDVILVDNIQRRGKTFCTYPLLVSQRAGYSDIMKKNVNYDIFIDKRYEQKTSGL